MGDMGPSSAAVPEGCTPPPRKSGPTILAALSTFALAMVQNWGIGVNKPNTFMQLLARVVFSASAPPLSIALSFSSADKARRLRSAVDSTPDSTSLRRIKTSLRQLASLMADCPIYIETPPGYKIEDIPIELYDELELDADKIYHTYPLEIFPEMISAQASLHTSKDPPTQRPPALLATSSLLARERILLNLSLNGKAWLLVLGLVPEYEKMRSIRKRSGFETLVFGAQASGSLLGIINRLWQKKSISPLEYMLTMVSIQMVFQAFLQWFGCTYYDRSLLFHLDSSQFNRWASQTTKLTPRNNRNAGFIVQVMVCLLYLVPTSYYGIRFIMPSEFQCIQCSIVAAFFLLALIMAFVSESISRSEKRKSKFCRLVYHFSLGMTNLVYVCSIFFSLVFTATTWSKYHAKSKTLLNWIIPHVRSE